MSDTDNELKKTTTKNKSSKTKKSSPKKPVRTYKEAGVDIDAGAEVARRIGALARDTFTSRVITDIGGFSGLYKLDVSSIKNPILVCSTDGVGTKLKLAFLTGIHDTVGIDLVAMCANDILAQGARPLFFLDYMGMAKVDPDVAEAIIKGIVAGCRQARCSLIGGETAELPDLYVPGEYDLAGFVVGVVEQDKIIDGSEIAVGDHVIGLASNGLHSNGYTLVRRLIIEEQGLNPSDRLFSGTVADELLRPTRIYVDAAHVIIRDFRVLGIAHITGGGLLENIPRTLPQGCQAVIHKDSWERPEIFAYLQDIGDISETEMFRTFNMGVGLVMVVPARQSEEVLDRLNGMQQQAWRIGEIKERPKGRDPILMI